MKFFTISEFSKLTNTPITKLRYYDEKNILKPEKVDDNKYRYYTFNQVQMIEWISLLKQCGLQIKQIAQLINNQKIDYNLIVNQYNSLINKKIEEIDNLKHNLERINKKEAIKNFAISQKQPYTRDLTSGLFIVQETTNIKHDRFCLTENLYKYIKYNNLVEKLSIIQKGFLYKNGKKYTFIEITNKKDAKAIDKDNLVEVIGGTHYCMVSKMNEIEKNIDKILKFSNKTRDDIDHVVCDKLIDEEMSMPNDIFEVQILYKKK